MSDTKISLTVDVRKGSGRHGEYTLSIGPLAGCGRTLTAAKQNLTDALLTALTAGAADPAFARDDDGGLIVAIPHLTGGVDHWKVDDKAPRQISSCVGTPRESLGGCHHYIVLGDEPMTGEAR